jgi:hypothetical protein
MSKIYLRVEAVNLGNFVYDTHDISTIRGGSYLLLHAIDSLADKFRDRLNLVTHAASQGIFWFKSTEDKQKICEDVLTHLNEQTGKHATFLLATQSDIPDDFQQVLEKLEAQIHRQQWRMPTIAIPQRTSQSEKECYLDGWRPGTDKYNVDPTVNDVWISKATQFRRSQGAKLRHDLFFKILGDERYLGQISSKDLGELSSDPSRGVLNGKIAFIHIDGNGFGSIRKELCKTIDDRKDFDTNIQGFRTDFLRKLLDIAQSNPAFQTKNERGEHALRLEVLLWGGDEMTMVVPAWVGWKVVKLFYEMCKDLKFKDKVLSHRAALIFCHHNAPILLIRQLAEDLLERTKKDIRDGLKVNGSFPGYDHAIGDSLHYLALESFDMLQGDLDAFLESYYTGAAYGDLLVPASELSTLLTTVHSIQTLLAYSKAIDGIKSIQRNNTDAGNLIRQLPPKQKTIDDQKQLQTAIDQLIAKSISRWYMVTDLWDYLPE